MALVNCNKKPPKEQIPTPVKNRKPVVLSAKRYEEIVAHSKQTEMGRTQVEADADQKYREYLKKGNDELIAKFQGNVKRTQEQKLQELRDHNATKLEQANESYASHKENQEQDRQTKILKAQQLIETLKPGPRSLHSAALHSEVLRARNVQRAMNANIEEARKRQEAREKRMAMPWMQNQSDREAEKLKKDSELKVELQHAIMEHKKKCIEDKKRLLEEQIAEREAVENEMKAQIEKEKAAMDKKRAALRKNALEAMKMVEQRKLRERMNEELDDRLCCVYNTGKYKLNKMQESAKAQLNATDIRSSVVEKTFMELAQKKKQDEVKENDRIQRDISRMQLQFTAEEQERVNREKAAKQARIEAYLREVEAQKMAKQYSQEVRRFELAQRYKNTEINKIFSQAQASEEMRKASETLKHLKGQVAEKQRIEKEERELQIACDRKMDYRDQKFFFQQAQTLMQDAYNKKRPLYPFAKVVNQYKRDNNIDQQTKVPRHLQSQLSIGLREQASDSGDQSTDKQPFNKDILQNCLKINELLVKEANDSGMNAESMQQPGSYAGKRRYGLDSVSTKSDGSGKLRYSMLELKQLNSCSGPILH